MWEKALTHLAMEGQQWTDVALAAAKLLGDSAFATMKREAIINAARQEGTEHLARLQKAFPGVGLLELVQALRVKYVELRLGGG